MDLFDFTSFFAWTFLNFLACCERIMDSVNKDLDIAINCVHPGFVNTDMSSHRGHFTPEEGTKPIIYAAQLPEKTMIRGKFIWYDCNIVDWEAKNCSK